MTCRVLVVDDSELIAREISRILGADLRLEVVGVGKNGVEAIEQAESLRPDVITLDVNMPVMNGIYALKYLMTRRPVPVVVVSSFTAQDSSLTFDCIRYGATDCMMKPGADCAVRMEDYPKELQSRVVKAGQVPAHALRFWRMGALSEALPELRNASRCLAITCGFSGLGPLLQLLNLLPVEPETSMVVQLEAPASVVRAFASYAKTHSSWQVTVPDIATDLRGGTAYFLCLESPMLAVASPSCVELLPFATRDPSSLDASVAALFESVGESFESRACGIVLSGARAGSSGGMRKLLDWGGRIVEQRKDSAIEPGSIGWVGELGLKSTAVDPDALACRVRDHSLLAS